MVDKNSLSDLTREQLYELVWSTPATKLAERFGVSDVAIAKRCQKLAVPRPERGYWAQLEAGKAVNKPELPLLPASPAEAFAEQATKPIPSSIDLPAEGASLHPLAARFLEAVKSSKLSYDKQRVHLRERELPEAEISKAKALQAVAVLHAVLSLVEARDIPFKRARSQYDGGVFRKGNSDLHLKIEEEMIEKPVSPGRPRTHYSSWHQDNKVPCGRLTFSLNPDRYNRQTEKRWSEGEKLPLGEIAAEVAKEVCRHFAAVQKQREAAAIEHKKQQTEAEIRWKKHLEQEAIRMEQEKKRQHEEALERTARIRQEDMLKAAEWWRLHCVANSFIAECERRWREAQSGEITGEQDAWLVWAREVARGLSPFESGYPEPTKDGAFDPSAVPFGGPYPEQRKFPQPPTMPEIPAPTIIHQSYGGPSHQPLPKPYPFWLKYQRR